MNKENLQTKVEALQDNLKIDKPFIYEKFFPMAIEGRYITIDTASDDESNNVHVHAHRKLHEADLMILLNVHPNTGDIRTDSLTISRK